MSLSLIVALTLSTTAPGEAAAAPGGHALIVTNNRSQAPDRPDLQYADDDGAQYAELFTAAFGEAGVTLLTTFDPQSAALHARWVPHAAPPTRANLFEAVERLARAARDGAEVYLVFAGHGDIEAGQGFIELEDGRLRASELERDVVARLSHTRVHLILDSCNSYFMLSPRKPGGRRFETAAVAGDGLLSRHPNVGAIVSTSAEAITYEWSELQSGIFSHEVRSGLRGGADADGDGRILYSELASFITVANRPLINDLYRPKIFARGQAANPDAVLLWAPLSAATRVEIPAAGQRRLTVRNAHGVRLMDVHKEDGASLVLALPSREGTLWISERVDGEDRPAVRTFLAEPSDQTYSIDSLRRSEQTLSARGEAPVFRALFDAPFGPAAFAEVSRSVMAPPNDAEAHFGVSRQDAQRLGIHLQYAADGARSQRLGVAVGSALVGGAVLATAFAPMPGTQEEQNLYRSLLIGAGGGMLLGGGLVALLKDEQELLAGEYVQMGRSTEGERATAVMLMERKFEAAAVKAERMRQILGVGTSVVGVAYVVGGLFFAPRAPDHTFEPWMYTSLGVGMILSGLYGVLFQKYPIERAWDFYQQDARLHGRDATGTAGPQVDIGLAPGGAQINVRWGF